ncbi:MAG: NTP transferase domain-containing protein, partial [Desulfurococcales archaeon]|nr:NTP transferase domain-containing protein [Desulfurococcales archaeon]
MAGAAVILAAGEGRRFRETGGVAKQSVRLRGLPLACYPVVSLALAGVGEILAVSSHVTQYYVSEALRECPYTPAWSLVKVSEAWRGNGYTAVMGLEGVFSRGECPVVSMMDHVYGVEVARALAGAPCWSIGVDSRPAYVDRREATKALVEGGFVRGLSKRYPPSLPVDVGVHKLEASVAETFYKGLCTPEGGELQLSTLITCTAKVIGPPRAVDVEGAPWKDVDDFWELESLERGVHRVVVGAYVPLN